MIGPPENPGLIPSTLNLVMGSIEGNLGPAYLLRADRQNGYEVQSELEMLLEAQRRDTQRREFLNNKANKFAGAKNYKRPELCDLNNSVTSGNNFFALFISFVEIYNNYIYDLLDDDIVTKGPQSKQVREDYRARPYIKDVKEIEARSYQEAMDLLHLGLKRRRIAYTQLNAESSRSHSVFTLRLVRFPDNISNNKLTKDDLHISTFNLVDLAGSERVNRAKTTGDRVKEASNINSSLMVLRQCFETMRENQANGTNKMIPYRESKLTSFFKSYFDGDGRIRMILCVNPHADSYDELQHTLKFGELTKDVIIPKELPPPPPPPPVPQRPQKNIQIIRELESQPHVQPVIFTEFKAQALIAPFPSMDYSLIDTAADDQMLTNLEDHLRRRIDERNRLSMLIEEQQSYLKKFTMELMGDYDLNISDRDDLVKENDTQSKTIRHLQTKIKLLEKSQNEVFKTNSQMERENKTLKSQLEDKVKEIKNLKNERRKDKIEMEEKLKTKLKTMETEFISNLKDKENKLAEREHEYERKLNIIRSMAGPSNLQTTQAEFLCTSRLDVIRSEFCGTPIGKSTPRRRPPTPYSQSTRNENDDETPVEFEKSRQNHRRSRSFAEIQNCVEIFPPPKYNFNDEQNQKSSQLNKVSESIEVAVTKTSGSKKRFQSEERVGNEPSAPFPSSRQGPAVPPKRFRM